MTQRFLHRRASAHDADTARRLAWCLSSIPSGSSLTTARSWASSCESTSKRSRTMSFARQRWWPSLLRLSKACTRPCLVALHSPRDHAAPPLPATVVGLERSVGRRRAARAPAVPRLCRPGPACRTKRPSFDCIICWTSTRWLQVLATINAGPRPAGPGAQNQHDHGCPHVYCDEFDQESRWRELPRDAIGREEQP